MSVRVVAALLLVCSGATAGVATADATAGVAPESATAGVEPAAVTTGPAATQADPARPENGTVFRSVETEDSALVMRVNLELLTSFFAKGSALRIVVGGAALGQRVVWFDIGIGYTGGGVFSNPLAQFVVRAEMEMNMPGF